jgi:hypothetical protein
MSIMRIGADLTRAEVFTTDTARQSATRKCLNLLQPRCQQRSESRTNPRRRANELEPYAYLRRLFAELPAAQTLEQIEALLPWNIKLNS